MSGLRKTGVVLLLALWVPATLHCQLETVPGLEFLSCCQHPDTEKSPAHHDNDCATDGCAAVESGLYYKEEKPSASSGMPLQALAVPLLPMADQEQTNRVIQRPDPSASPPGLSRTWQFTLRAALPIRAPSLPS